MGLLDTLLGRPLADDEEEEQKIGVMAGLPLLGIDALTSAAYGAESALVMLLPLGVQGIHYVVPIEAIILVLLFILYLSYRQTIGAYAGGGGSYTVARENLGENAGLVAAAALLTDYILTVAVGISAGVGALVSAFPVFQPHLVSLCLGILFLVTMVNLRGVKESGVAFALPTYAFVGTLATVVFVGLWKTAVSGGHPVPVDAPPVVPAATEAVGAWLLIRAFANGCAAMTGVEAVSNGVLVFKEPRQKNAIRTLTMIVVFLSVLLAGIAYLTHVYNIAAMDPDATNYQSVDALLIAAVMGHNWFYYTTIGSILVALAVSCNTAFADFPRLCNLLARDNYLPHSMASRGRRLVFSVGIGGLALLAGVLLVVFRGVTDRLIPLYAIGAFTAFTLSQAGMVQHWRKHVGKGSGLSLVLNATGAVATGIALVVVVAAKFTEGAWLTLLVMPLLILLFRRTHNHYHKVELEVASDRPINLEHLEKPVVVVPIKGWSSITEKAIRFALLISDLIICVYVQVGESDISELQARFDECVVQPVKAQGLRPPTLEIIPSPYRILFRPMHGFIRKVLEEYPDRTIAVIIPELAETRWHQYLLHNQRATWLKAALLMWGENRVAVINVPWFLHKIPEHEQLKQAKLSALFSES